MDPRAPTAVVALAALVVMGAAPAPAPAPAPPASPAAAPDAGTAGAPDAGDGTKVLAIGAREFRFIERESGPDNYYSYVDGKDDAASYIHAAYKHPYRTAVLGYAIPDKYRNSVERIRWRWRAVALPKDGNECVKGKGDSSAVVYVTFRSGLRWYSLKYVWSAVGTKGEICDRKSNVFRVQDTIIAESGGPLNEWRQMDIDPKAEWRKHFAKGDPDAKVPALVGLGIMSDGDQTKSHSGADYGGFELVVR